MPIGYCTNVHAGANLQTTRENLERYALDIKQRFSPSAPMGIGLWLSAITSTELMDEAALDSFSQWLQRNDLIPFTLNGFPFGDFHEAVVKHRVYEPTWADTARTDYTIRLAHLLDRLLPAGERGSISTLPLGWGTRGQDERFLAQCAAQLRRVADALDELAQRTGREIMLSLEPEPGCAFDTAEGAAAFFDRWLPNDDSAQAQRVRRHIGICHDICHSAVMNEKQEHAFRVYAAHDLRVGKVQVSSAIRLTLSPDPLHNQQALQHLRSFAEDRYLHQTTVISPSGTSPADTSQTNTANPITRFYEDLPLALAEAACEAGEEWRIHFHVPIHEARLGLISSTRDDIQHCLNAIAETQTRVDHFEVETYAWNVLPSEHRVDGVVTGIANELNYFQQLIAADGRVAF